MANKRFSNYIVQIFALTSALTSEGSKDAHCLKAFRWDEPDAVAQDSHKAE